MTDRVGEICVRFDALTDSLSSPGVASDPSRVASITRELKILRPVVEAYREAERLKKELAQLESISSFDPDAEIREIASSEAAETREKLAEAEAKLQIALIPKDPDGDRNVVVEIRAGAGGEEAALFAGELYRMYCMYAASRGFTVGKIGSTDTELGGYREISFTVEGEGAYSSFRFESGVHRVQRVPDTESQGRIHTSTATVAVLPEAEEVEVKIDPSELRIDTIKSSGAGGQHINKTESAVRITYLPSGLVVECRDERSQLKNKDKAMRVLRSRLYDIRKRQADGAIADVRRSQVGSGDRSEKIRTYNFPQSRVTDHRIGYTTHDLEGVLNGRLNGITEALAAAESAAKMSGNKDENT
ncbi:MAG: peptide chain release factor 1 [Clostridia bacterium]|nr:peptide chain release factor 1 [Clostridia bacterium]